MTTVDRCGVDGVFVEVGGGEGFAEPGLVGNAGGVIVEGGAAEADPVGFAVVEDAAVAGGVVEVDWVGEVAGFVDALAVFDIIEPGVSVGHPTAGKCA